MNAHDAEPVVTKSASRRDQEIGHPDGRRHFGDRLLSSLTLDGPVETSPLPGLPVPPPWRPPGPASAYYTVTAMDTWGRLADRSPLTTLGWMPGLSLAMRVTPSAVVATHDPEGHQAVTRQGHLRLPAPIRHLFRLAAGDRLLLVACQDRGFLVVYPIAILDAMTLAYHGETAGGGAAP